MAGYLHLVASKPRHVHPYRDLAFRQWVLTGLVVGGGVLLGGLTVLAGGTFPWHILPLLVVGTSFFASMAWALELHGRALAELGESADRLARGHLDEAEEALAQIPSFVARSRVIARPIALQRGLIALA